MYNQPRYLRISVFPIMQLNSNATPLRICPHFVLMGNGLGWVSARNRAPFMYDYYIRNSLWGEAILDVWSPKTRTFQQKNSSPEMINFFSYCIIKMSFSSSPKGTPHDRCRRTMKKTSLQGKLMELGGIPQKNDEYFHWGPIFYVCSFARNRVPFMSNYYIRNSLWVEAILDVWSS